jgi:hypothetical protein
MSDWHHLGLVGAPIVFMSDVVGGQFEQALSRPA